MLLFRKPEHILENQVIFFFYVSVWESSQITELDAAFTSSDPSPVFVNWILSHHPSLEDTSHVTSGYIHQIWAVFCVPGQFRFAGFLLVCALRMAAGAPGCSHACDVFCRSVSAAVLREARAAVGATITGRAWRRGTVLKAFLVLSLDIFLL